MAASIEQLRLPHEFFQRDAVTVARGLLGAILVRHYRGRVLRARVVETEAYVGPHDLACHASKGRTVRTEVMFLPGGHAYVYFIYGMYDMLNVVTGKADEPQAVLVRAAEPLDGWHKPPHPRDLAGPGKLTRALHITRTQNGLDLTSNELHFLPPERPPWRIVATPRIGVDYAREWKGKLLRFVDAESPTLSVKLRSGET